MQPPVQSNTNTKVSQSCILTADQQGAHAKTTTSFIPSMFFIYRSMSSPIEHGVHLLNDGPFGAAAARHATDQVASGDSDLTR